MSSSPRKTNNSGSRSFFKGSSSDNSHQKTGWTLHIALCISLLILLLHSVYIFFTYLKVPMNSDFANQILEAGDILKGNILLKGWNLTGVSFYFSELPFYVLGTAVAGVDTYAYIIAASVMVVCVNLLGFLLAFRNHGKNPIPKALFYLALIGFPTETWLGFLRGHCGIFIYLCLMLLVLRRITEEKVVPVVSWILIGVLAAFGCMSDMQILIIGIIPILLFCVINLLRNDPHFDPKHTAWLAGILICGIVLGIVMDALLMKLGGINKNSFLDTRRFVDMDRLGEKFLLLGKGILNVFRIDLPAAEWAARDIISLCCVSIIILTALFFLCSSLLRYLRHGTGDPVSAVISLSLTVMFIICFFTDVYIDEDGARYISYFPFAACILICRGLEASDLPVPAHRQDSALFGSGHPRTVPPAEDRIFNPLSCILLFFAAGILFFRMPAAERRQTPQDRLAIFLSENGLTDGYADFWNASHTTASSGNRVRVRAIRGRVPELGKPDHLEMHNWFCKSDWYLSGPHDFIVFDGSGYLHVSEDVVTKLLGDPDRILETDGYRVYVYDRDLTGEIVLPAGIARPQ